jgi:chemotaxis protein methyltransferase CheR
MHEVLPQKLLLDLSQRVAGQMGLYFPADRLHELEAGLQAAAQDLGIDNVVSWARELLSAPLTRAQVEMLAGELTIGETYFLREKAAFAAFTDHILPELIGARRGREQRLRVWSAGCCTGEEAYSIAILLDRALPDPSAWQVTILGTDINPRFLRKAAEGIYGDWSFRDTPAWLREKYFRPVAPRRVAILPRIRQRLTFSYLNLAEDHYPSLPSNTNAMDVIFCRNVLMYFTPERARAVVSNFRRSLRDGGWLIVSAVETGAQSLAEFVPVPFEGATLYRNVEALAPAPMRALHGTTAFVARDSAEPLAALASPSFAPQDSMAPFAFDPTPLEAPASATSEHRPATSAVLLDQATALYERGDYAQAARHLTASADDIAGHVGCLTLLARAHANLGELSQARAWADQAIAADKVEPAAHYLRALILQEQGSTAEAVATLKRTLYLAPDFPLAHFALGNVMRQQGRYKEARRHFANALQLLQSHRDDEMLPHSEGLVAGRLREMIESLLLAEGAA